MHIDEIYQSAAFRLLAQGMKDREAIEVVFALKSFHAMTDPRNMSPFEIFERWAQTELDA